MRGTSLVYVISPLKGETHKMKRVLIAFLAVMMIAGAAFAQGGAPGGGRRPGQGGPGGGGEERGPGGNVIVADNGTVFAVADDPGDLQAPSPSMEIKAISTTGATLWTSTLSNRRGRLVLSGSNLLSVSDSSTDAAASSTITAISTASGATAWTLNITGRITDLEPYSGGTYAVVVTPAATDDAPPTRSLVAISNSGTVLWSASL